MRSNFTLKSQFEIKICNVIGTMITNVNHNIYIKSE